MGYKGAQVPIPLGQLGLRTDDATTSLPPNSLQKANNVSLYSGRIEKSLGSAKFNSTALESGIVALYDWYPTPSSKRLIALTINGKVWRDTGDGTFSSATAIKTGLGTLTPDAHMVEGGAEATGNNKKLFLFCNGAAQFQRLNGDSTTVLPCALPSADWASSGYPTFGIMYQGYHVVFGGSNDRHRVYLSTLEDHENFVGQTFGNTSWELWGSRASPADLTATVQGGAAVSIFTTTNGEGFELQGAAKFNKATFVVSQAATGLPVYSYTYWNGASWASLTTALSAGYDSTGSKNLTWTIPSDWATGDGSEPGNNNKYSIRVLAATAPSTAVQITSMSVINTTASSQTATFPIFPGEGEGLIGAAVYRGLLFLFKRPTGVYILDGLDPVVANWTVAKYSAAFGIASPHSVLQILGDLVAANSFGSYTSLQASNTFGDFEAGDLLSNNQVENYIRGQFSSSGLPYVHSLYYPEKKLALFSGQSSTTDLRDRMLAIDVAKQTPRISIVTKDNPNCLALRKDSLSILRPIYGTATGFVYLTDQANYSIAGSPYTGEFQTSYTDFSFADATLAGKNKIFDFLTVNYIPVDNTTFYCDIYVDGQYRQTLSFTQNYGTGLDAFTLGISMLAGDPVGKLQRKRLLSCTGNKISFRFYSSTAYSGFKIERIVVNFKGSGEQSYSFQL